MSFSRHARHSTVRARLLPVARGCPAGVPDSAASVRINVEGKPDCQVGESNGLLRTEAGRAFWTQHFPSHRLPENDRLLEWQNAHTVPFLISEAAQPKEATSALISRLLLLTKSQFHSTRHSSAVKRATSLGLQVPHGLHTLGDRVLNNTREDPFGRPLPETSTTIRVRVSRPRGRRRAPPAGRIMMAAQRDCVARPPRMYMWFALGRRYRWPPGSRSDQDHEATYLGIASFCRDSITHPAFDGILPVDDDAFLRAATPLVRGIPMQPVTSLADVVSRRTRSILSFLRGGHLHIIMRYFPPQPAASRQRKRATAKSRQGADPRFRICEAPVSGS
ncbi:hypothetical protein WOLCODRAFT_152128 [Wolfiporia cocos MD-104 SS10]|uniref:Uncharacterized protein n=1 Tax=Wolfiporia cocos (strain MD-104) TaxID=742152 RepID=A0A2H3JW70_WOLCO|nr:hypothetical protein WOLCODRAFT_152128 [Wolfiporia cocos MD-104 SS10]